MRAGIWDEIWSAGGSEIGVGNEVVERQCVQKEEVVGLLVHD